MIGIARCSATAQVATGCFAIVAGLLAVGPVGRTSKIRLSSPACATPLLGDPDIVRLVPDSFGTGGLLEVGTDASYPPFEYVDPATGAIAGFDADLASDVAALMGMKAHLVNMPFDNLIPSLASGRLQIAMSSLGDTTAREAVVDFVTYYWNSTNLLVPADNPKRLATDSLCGTRVGVERGSLQQTDILPLLTAACGANEASVLVFQDNTQAALALSSGRVDGVLNDAVANDYASSHSGGRFSTAGPRLRNRNPGGIAIRKESGLQAAILAAVKRLMANGTYSSVLTKWGLTTVGIDNAVLNGATR